MKKLIIFIAIITTILSVIKENKVIIPKDSIRFRIVANSNDEYDQNIKKEILKNISSEIQKTSNLKNIEDTRTFLNNEIPVFNKIVDKTLSDNNYEKNFHINYGKNYFPEKIYKNVKYEEGENESIVITIGEGKGKNFWCVLFPPLCLVDETEENLEYKSLVKEIINKYF